MSSYPLLNVFWTMLIFFGFVVWFWLLISIFTDLFRRHDVSGWAKAGWTVFVIVLPVIGILTYLVVCGRGMAERRRSEAEAARAQYESEIRAIAGDGSQPAEQIAKAKRLLDAGDISAEEYQVLKQKALAGTGSSTATGPTGPVGQAR